MANERKLPDHSEIQDEAAERGVPDLAVVRIKKLFPDALVLSFKKGDVIKPADTEQPFAYIVTKGIVAAQRDQVSGHGINSTTGRQIHDLWWFNDAAFHKIDNREDIADCFVAKTDTVEVMRVTQEDWLNLLDHPVDAFRVMASIAHSKAFQELAQSRMIFNLMGQRRSLKEELMAKDKEIRRLENSASITEQAHIEQLLAKDNELLEKDQELASERERVTKRDQKNGALLEDNKQLRKQTMTTARDALELVRQSEQKNADAAVSAIDFFLRVARVLGIQLSQLQIETARGLTHGLVPKFSDDVIERLLNVAWPDEHVTTATVPKEPPGHHLQLVEEEEAPSRPTLNWDDTRRDQNKK